MRVFSTLLLYTVVFFLLQCWVVLWLAVHQYAHLQLGIPWRVLLYPAVYQGLLFFFAMQAALCLALLLVLTGLTQHWAKVWQLRAQGTRRLAIVLWCLAWLSVFVINQHCFPGSAFAFFADHPVVSRGVAGLSYVLGTAWTLLLLHALYVMLKRCRYCRYTFVVIAMVSFVSWLNHLTMHAIDHRASFARPNIIIIGLDGLRPDSLAYGGATSSLMPQLDAFLIHATRFKAASTPLARTFPAWVSILTGNDPKHSGARYSLPPYHDLHLGHDLPRLLKAQGYSTLFATDERRFFNVDRQHFAFDRVFAPPFGADEFLLASLSDFPLSNLWVNTPLGRIMFPYNADNRSASLTYEPHHFAQGLSAQLARLPKQPAFIAIHLCLSHWDWRWAQSFVLPAGDSVQALNRTYQRTLPVMDQQFKTIVSQLKQAGFLKNAWVVVLSDHGQSMGAASDQLLAFKDYQGKHTSKVLAPLLTVKRGHGSSVINQAQMHSVLAFRYFAPYQLSSGNVSVPVSLIDIAPTLMQAIKQPMAGVDGHSLLPWIKGKAVPVHDRALFFETGWTVSGLQAVAHDVGPVLKQSRGGLQVLPNGRVVVKPAFGEVIIKGKQRAVAQGDWLLAYVPEAKQSPWVIVNLKTHRWTDDQAQAQKMHAPIVTLRKQLFAFYGDEMKQRG